MGTELSDNKKVALISGITGQVLKRFLGLPELILTWTFYLQKGWFVFGRIIVVQRVHCARYHQKIKFDQYFQNRTFV